MNVRIYVIVYDESVTFRVLSNYRLFFGFLFFLSVYTPPYVFSRFFSKFS
jgi:hypothetical protein